MKYTQIWNAVDKLAKINGLSPSGLAKKAGLDSTTFNKSKRIRPDGKKRWPSLESINKITSVCNISFDDFYRLASDDDSIKEETNQNIIPLFEFSKLSKRNSPSSESEATIRFPEIIGNMFAVEIDSKIMQNIYDEGSVIIVADNAEIRRTDKVLITHKDGSVSLGKFTNRTASTLKIEDFCNNGLETSVKISSIASIGRILWVSQ